MRHTINVELVKNYGATQLKVSLSGEKMVEHEKGVPEFDAMMDNLKLYFEFFEKEHLPHMSGLNATKRITETDTEPALEIRVTMRAGKRYFNVATPKYQEHGVPFYDEHMKECKIDPGQIPDEGHKCKEGTRALIEYESGKPKRVLKLIAPTT